MPGVRQDNTNVRILITTISTRGDVQPYIALGRALAESGYEITICTCAHFESFVKRNGLAYAYANDEIIDFIHSPEGKIVIENAGSLWKTLATAVRLIPKLGHLQEQQRPTLLGTSGRAAQSRPISHIAKEFDRRAFMSRHRHGHE